MKFDETSWLAGLLEGEGSFMIGPPSSPNRPCISIQMTDEDVIMRVSRIFGVKPLKLQRGIEKGWKPSCMIHLRGKRAIELMRIVFPYMGNRRKKQIERAIQSYKPDNRFLTVEEVMAIKKRLSKGETVSILAKEYNVCGPTISKIKLGQRHS